ncbi:MAG TPA: sugar-binding domain-containing protein [Patescibacteria group bacterium]|nr:sugar-binding domain-containing protein [Patescibacteria group bacterium]
MEIADLRATSPVMAMAAGTTKALPILGALRTGVIDVLVTDLATAETVLTLANRSR